MAIKMSRRCKYLISLCFLYCNLPQHNAFRFNSKLKIWVFLYIPNNSKKRFKNFPQIFTTCRIQRGQTSWGESVHGPPPDPSGKSQGEAHRLQRWCARQTPQSCTAPWGRTWTVSSVLKTRIIKIIKLKLVHILILISLTRRRGIIRTKFWWRGIWIKIGGRDSDQKNKTA